MSKRKLDCTLDNVVFNYLKRAKYDKTAKMVGVDESKSSCSKTMEKFLQFLAAIDIKKQKVEDDLGFEINFGAYQPEPRLQLKQISNFTGKKNGPKSEDKKEKIEIPKKFIKKIKNLGLREKDADILYKSKIDWTAIYLGRISNCCRLDSNISLIRIQQFENLFQRTRFIALKSAAIFTRKSITRN